MEFDGQNMPAWGSLRPTKTRYKKIKARFGLIRFDWMDMVDFVDMVERQRGM
jgi:hypothetical protein